ncbi:MAG: IgGFc-binding protein [Candidatus Kapabacteria bacterium]|nr:IgGFc-binding protein [Candidatus Kapabacteria bacterium]
MKPSTFTNVSNSLIMIFVVLCCSVVVFSQNELDQTIKKLPSYLNSSNAGTEFYISVPTAKIETIYPNDGCYLYISSQYQTEVEITNDAKGSRRVIQTKPNDVMKVKIPENEIQAYLNQQGTNSGHNLSETVIPLQALHIVSNDPIVVYGCIRYSYTSDAFLAIPTSSWGQEYIVNTYKAHEWSKPANNLASMTTIVAAYDSTKVIFTLNGTITTNTVGGLTTGQSKSLMLNKGDVVPIASGMLGLDATLAGSKIVATKPIGVFSGVQCADVPTDVPWCDYLVDMELPTSVWGTEYHVTKNFNRNAGPLFQVVAKEPNTIVSVNGIVVDTLSAVGNSSMAEWTELNAKGDIWFGNNGNVVVSADKPISVTTFNQGQSLDNIQNDPFQVTCYPIDQYRNEIVFATPGIGDGGGFNQNFINVIYPVNNQNEIPDDLLFGEVDSNGITWTPVKNKFGNQHSQLFYGNQNGKQYAVKNIQLAKEGVYHLQCSEEIGCYSYGMSSFDSYGMPSFVGLKDNSMGDLVAPNIVFEQYVNGTIGGIEKNEYAEVVDRATTHNSYSNIAKVLIRSEYTSNYSTELKPFVAGIDRSAFFKANVIDVTKDAQLVVSTFDKAGNDTTIIITYKSLTTSISEKASDKFMNVYPSITDGGVVTIELTQGSANSSMVSVVGIDGKVVKSFDNVLSTNGVQTIQFITSELPIGMYYVLYSMNGQQYQKSFVKIK